MKKPTKISQVEWTIVNVKGGGIEIRFHYRNKWHTVCDLYCTPEGSAAENAELIVQAVQAIKNR